MKTRLIKVAAIRDEKGLHVKDLIEFDYTVVDYSEDEKWAFVRMFGEENAIKEVAGEEVEDNYPRVRHTISDKDDKITDSDDETEIGKTFEEVSK